MIFFLDPHRSERVKNDGQTVPFGQNLIATGGVSKQQRGVPLAAL